MKHPDIGWSHYNTTRFCSKMLWCYSRKNTKIYTNKYIRQIQNKIIRECLTTDKDKSNE